jgi:hypothetical protein
MLYAAIHHIHNLAGFQKVMGGVPVYPQANEHWKASSVWEASEGLSVIDVGKLIDQVCGRYAANECCELTKPAARRFEKSRHESEDDDIDVEDAFDIAHSLKIKIVTRYDQKSRNLYIYRVN